MKSKVKKVATETAETYNSHHFAEEKLDFKHFDTVTDYSDHHYFKTKDTKLKDHNDDCFTKPSSSVHKKIMQEWNILKENLPESIYVRVYESKINLLRAVIIGAAGTPYQDGLFFFDLAFPSDYPKKPPLLNFLSHGLHLNPNLYSSGYVCLSLLNTWSGNSQERWIPGKSTILQLLLSIQALVLNEKPFFNEPCFSNQQSNAAYREKSMLYDQNAFMLSCKMMQFLIHDPPKNFEGFVSNHFCKRAHVILAAFNAYRSGEALVGQFHIGGGEQSSSSSSTGVVSTFKTSMGAIYPNLVKAFINTGASRLDGSEKSEKANESNSRNSKRKAIFPESELRRSLRLKMKKEQLLSVD